ncbi:MAG: hypothetical protein O3C21_12275 [Verrucomicrobia bacterium]|nr:hypothetical protein [Verrucomicrobiota bacterium]
MDTLRSEPIYESADGNADELARAIRVCLMGGDVNLPLTFTLGSGGEGEGQWAREWAREWDHWRNHLFANVLAPHLIKVFTAAHLGDVHAVIQLDQALGDQFSMEVAERSAMAGCQFHSSMDGARHVKMLEKLRKAVLDQKIVGHHSTFFATEAAIFHVPMMHVLPAYLYAEWRSGRLPAGIPASRNGVESFYIECRGALIDSGSIFAKVIGGGEHSFGVCA